MTKTIEEAANEYAANWEAKHNIHNPELYDLIVDAYKASAEHMMSLLLASRLTAEEKERVKRTLNMYYGKWREHPNEATEAVYCTVKETFEAMFGKNFFQE